MTSAAQHVPCTKLLITCWLLFLLAGSAAPAAVSAAAPNAAGIVIHQPDYKLYSHKDDILGEVEDIVAANPKTMQITQEYAEDAGYNVSIPVVRVELGGRTSDALRKTRLLLDFGQHGREYVTSELALRLLRALGEPQQVAAVLGDALRAERVVQLMHQMIIQIVPMENIRGREVVEKGNLCERKNGRGVDPNRNWDIDWGKKEKDYDPNEEYPGKAAFSEPEAKVLLRVARALQPHVWLNVHSGMYAMFTPYDHRPVVPDTADAAEALRILHRLNNDTCGGHCVVGSGGKSVGYLAHGTATDYMYEVLRVPVAYTWEIYGDFKASYHDCFTMFNPLTKEALEANLQQWLRALFMLIELLPTHPSMPCYTQSAKSPADESRKSPSPQPGEQPADAQRDAPSKQPGEQPADAQRDAPSKQPGEQPADAQRDAPSKQPGEQPANAQRDAPSKQPGERSGDAPSERTSEQIEDMQREPSSSPAGDGTSPVAAAAPAGDSPAEDQTTDTTPTDAELRAALGRAGGVPVGQRRHPPAAGLFRPHQSLPFVLGLGGLAVLVYVLLRRTRIASRADTSRGNRR